MDHSESAPLGPHVRNRSRAPRPARVSPCLATTLLLVAFPLHCPAQILADFVVGIRDKEFGRFTAQLDFLYSPHAVGNFIRLAEGMVPWLDAEDGRVRTEPFYDGLTFHATTPGVEVVAGSQDGEGRDNAGWTFRDDFTSAGSGQYTLYMENEGPNTNGSRFFINIPSTLNANPARTGGAYTAAGVVLIPNTLPGGNGRATVSAISNIPGGFLHIDTIRLRYLNEDARAFRRNLTNPQHPSLFLLPSARPAHLSFHREGTSLLLRWDDTSGSALRLWSSPNLKTWTGALALYNVPGGESFGYDLTPNLGLFPRGFFRGGVIDYPQWPSTERPLAGSTVITSFRAPGAGPVETTFVFDQTGRSGLYDGSFGPGEFSTPEITTTPYSNEIQFNPETGALPTYRLTFHYDLAWSNNFPPLAVPRIANPSRLDGFDILQPAASLQGGTWSYVPGQ